MKQTKSNATSNITPKGSLTTSNTSIVIPKGNIQSLSSSAFKYSPTDFIPSFVTHINDINQNKHDTTFYIDDESSYRLIMLDMTNKKEVQSTLCFWDKHPFDTHPIGCPIRYVSPVLQKTVYSEITKERYDIRQSVPRMNSLTDEKNNCITGQRPANEVCINENGYYEVDGSFCSGNCVLAFIQSQRNNPLYSHSKSLLYKMYLEHNQRLEPPVRSNQRLEPPVRITPAADWRLLSAFGGYMDINTFRDSFNNFTYHEKMYNITKVPKMNYIGKVYEELPIL